jgi:hypothetical protein
MTENEIIDRLEISKGFDRGNYANAYETEDFEIAEDKINGATGFYRLGFIVGFFSSYELNETPEEYRDALEHARGVLRAMPELGIAID